MAVIGPAPRSTRAALAEAEAIQGRTISALSVLGEDDISARLTRCQSARILRHERWRCLSAGCWSCRRTAVRAWWRGILAWSPPGVLLMFRLHHTAGQIIETSRRLRRALRDFRDRRARKHFSWRDIAMAGLVTGDAGWVLASGMPAMAVFGQRWADVRLADSIEMPSAVMPVLDCVQLAIACRGIQPLRLFVGARGGSGAARQPVIDPMPMLI